MNRCLNCGGLGHGERVCPRYGPHYPEPGKTAEDYADERVRIMNLVAEDIVKEHDGPSEDDDTPFVVNPIGRGHISQRELEYRTIPCSWCDAEAGVGCKSGNGGTTRVHKMRVDAYKALEAAR